MYLRKSRMDKDYDELSVEETLKRHQQILNDLASKNNYFIEKTYKEVVSGESISERPEVQKLLTDISTGAHLYHHRERVNINGCPANTRQSEQDVHNQGRASSTHKGGSSKGSRQHYNATKNSLLSANLGCNNTSR